MSLHRITEFYTKCSSVCTNITYKFHSIDICKIFFKQKRLKTYRYDYYLLLYQTSFV
jgi:hypothetical protein